jgi:hypothetical protein
MSIFAQHILQCDQQYNIVVNTMDTVTVSDKEKSVDMFERVCTYKPPRNRFTVNYQRSKIPMCDSTWLQTQNTNTATHKLVGLNTGTNI